MISKNIGKLKQETKHFSHLKVKREWYLFDASKFYLGRLASQIAIILMGKHRSYFSPHADVGDSVAVINAEKIKISGQKLESKKYYKHTGYIGLLKETSLKEPLAKDCKKDIFRAVKNMLPKNKLQKNRLKRLRIFINEKHGMKNISFKTMD